jgi:hypothetical protein
MAGCVSSTANCIAAGALSPARSAPPKTSTAHRRRGRSTIEAAPRKPGLPPALTSCPVPYPQFHASIGSHARIGEPPTGEWGEDDYAVLADEIVVGRIMNAHAAPVDAPWMWTLAFGHDRDRTPTHGYAATREAGMSPDLG